MTLGAKPRTESEIDVAAWNTDINTPTTSATPRIGAATQKAVIIDCLAIVKTTTVSTFNPPNDPITYENFSTGNSSTNPTRLRL